MYELNKHPLSLGYCKMAALEGLEEKLSTIWYIEIPTHFTSGLGNLTNSRQAYDMWIFEVANLLS